MCGDDGGEPSRLEHAEPGARAFLQFVERERARRRRAVRRTMIGAACVICVLVIVILTRAVGWQLARPRVTRPDVEPPTTAAAAVASEEDTPPPVALPTTVDATPSPELSTPAVDPTPSPPETPVPVDPASSTPPPASALPDRPAKASPSPERVVVRQNDAVTAPSRPSLPERVRGPERIAVSERVAVAGPVKVPDPAVVLPERVSRPHREVPAPSALPFVVGRDATVVVGDLVITVYQDARLVSDRRVVDYTVRLVDGADRPVSDAEVQLRGRSRDGSLLEARIEPSSPGTYAAALMLPRSGLVELALRVARAHRVVEVPVAVSGVDAAFR